MDWHNSLPTYPLNLGGKVIVLEAEPGQNRSVLIQQWLQEVEVKGATNRFLICDCNESGSWAGVNDLLNAIVPEIQTLAPDLIIKHDYELVKVLPSLQRKISVRHLTLTDAPLADERVSFLPRDRVFRSIHGLVNLLAYWFKPSEHSSWVIACDCYNHASSLVRRFFVELMRRSAKDLNLTLLVATNPGASEAITNEFDSQTLGIGVKISLPCDQSTLVCEEEMARLAQEIESFVYQDPIELEIYLPRLIHYWLLSNKPEKALPYQMQACSNYMLQGFYEDALLYGEAALVQIERHCPEDVQKRWDISVNLHYCYVAMSRYMQSLQVIENAMAKTNAPEHFYKGYSLMSTLYSRYFKDKDLAKAEKYLELSLEQLSLVRLSEDKRIFITAINRRGLALIRHQQKRSDEALQLCWSSYEETNRYAGLDKYRPHQSLLLYNISLVHASTGSYEEALKYLTDALEIDPNDSDFYNHRGNIFLKIGRLDEAKKDYLKAIDLSPPYPGVWANLGQYYRLTGQITEAINSYSIALDLEPDHELALVGRAQAFEVLENPKAALADYSAVLVLKPNHPQLLAKRAMMNYHIGQLIEALSDLDNAISLSPANPTYYYNRAVVLTFMERFEDAAQDLQTYLLLDPNTEIRTEIESKLRNLQDK